MTNKINIRKKNESILIDAGIPLHPHLPLIEDVSLKKPRQVAERIVATYVLGGLANDADPTLLKEWLVDEGCWDILLPQEKIILEQSELDNSVLNELSWMPESSYALAWAGNVVKQMDWPGAEADLEVFFEHIPPEVPISRFISEFALRNVGEIFQELDLYYCLHASAAHPELWGGQSINVKLEVILARRQALEWLCSGKTLWTEISLDT